MTDAPQLYLMTPAGAQASSLAPMLAEVMDRVAPACLRIRGGAEEDELGRLADMLVGDEKMRARLDDYMTRTAAYVAVNYAGEVTSIIADTVERWDADETSEKIELLAGKDLQFIRINGTLVGALVGVIIHQFTLLVF